MSLRPGFRVVAGLVLILGACSPGSLANGPGSGGLTAASSGVCQAIAALPDVASVEVVFLNVAHDALHALAAEPRLDRQLSAQVLQTMQKVETDFSQRPGVASLAMDLAALHAAADAALVGIGQTASRCPG